MASGQWEVVGADRKKKNVNGSSVSEKKGGDVNKPEKVVLKPREAARSLQKFKLNMNKNEDEDDHFFVKEDTHPPASSKSQKSKKTTPSKPKTLKDAITRLNLSELQGLLKTLRSQFNNDPIIWLKDLASFLNVRLNPSTPVDSAYRQEPGHAPPLEYVSLPVREFLVRVVQNCSLDVLSQFHRHCFTCMLHEAMRGLPVHGFATFIQVLGNVCRDACVVYSKDYIGLREMYDNHPRPGLTYVWLLSQTITTAASAKHSAAAVTMWVEGLLPLVSSKQYSALVAQCGRDMLSRMDSQCQAAVAAITARENGTSRQQDGTPKRPVVVTCKQLLQLLDVAYCPTTQVPRNINKQLGDIFNKFKVLCCSSSESSAVFQQVMPRLLPSCSPVMAQQISSACAACLQSSDAKCWNIWQQMLPKHTLQSAKLLKLISSDDSTVAVLASPFSQSTLASFERTCSEGPQDAARKELGRELQRVKVGVATSLVRRQQKQQKRGTGSGPGLLRRLTKRVMLALLLLAVVGGSCVFLHDRKATFEDSLMGQLAAKAGVVPQTLNVIEKVATLTRTAIKSSVSCSERLRVTVQPYLSVMQGRAADASAWVGEKYPSVVSSVSEAAGRAAEAGQAAWGAVKPQLLRLVDRAGELLSSENISGLAAAVSNFTAQLVGSDKPSTTKS